MILKEEWLLVLASTLYGNKVLPPSKYLPDMLGNLFIFVVTMLHCITKMILQRPTRNSLQAREMVDEIYCSLSSNLMEGSLGDVSSGVFRMRN
jgi:hypothetical protein